MKLKYQIITGTAAALAISFGATVAANAMPFLTKSSLQSAANPDTKIIKVGSRRKMRAAIIGGAIANGELNRGRRDGEITYYDDGKYEDGVIYGFDGPKHRRYRKLGRYLQYHRENVAREPSVIFYDYGNPTLYQRY